METTTTLKSRQLVASGKELWQISTVYPNHVTAQLLYPIPTRTTVREFDATAIAKFRRPSTQLIHKYEDEMGFNSPWRNS